VQIYLIQDENYPYVNALARRAVTCLSIE